MDAVDAVVVGAGVVGLAVGRALARAGLETLVLEREPAVGTQTSARNSEVLHAGLYYPTGSLKARLCVRGRAQLEEHLAAHGVRHRRCGKLIVATDEAQRPALDALALRAASNDVDDLQRLTAAEARALEPALDVVAALLSPSTGIVDSHALMLSLQAGLEAAGGAVVLRSPVLAIEPRGGAHVIVTGGAAPTRIAARIVVNAAGLWATRLAASIPGAAAAVPAARPSKGNYFSLVGRAPFRRLIYPLPEPGGLGVHLTLDLAGQARFGPDVEPMPDAGDPDTFDYRVDAGRRGRFETAIRRWWPALADGALQPAYSGVRPRVEGSDDFVLQGPAEHGIDGLIHLFGIDSPGLTASLALADEVVSRVLRPQAASGR